MKTPMVEAVLEMGFSRRLVKQTVQSKILTTGENYKTVNDLVSDLITSEDEKKEEEKEDPSEKTTSGIYKFHSISLTNWSLLSLLYDSFIES